MKNSIILLICSLTVQLSAQRSISGIVVDEHDVGIPFAAVGIVNTPIGIITNSGGEFKLKIPLNIEVSDVLISHVSFLPTKITLPPGEEFLKIKLEENVISLGEVQVQGFSAKSIITKAVENKSINYHLDELTYTVYSINERFEKSSPLYVLEAVVLMNRDFSGGKNKVDLDIQKLRGKPFSKSTRGEFKKARTTWLMNLEFVELEHLLTKSLIKKATFEVDTVLEMNGRKIFQISSKSNKPEYRGRFYVDAETYAVTRFEAISGHFVLDYKNINGKWLMSSYSRGFSYSSGEPSTLVSKYVVTNVDFSKPKNFNAMGFRVVKEVKHHIDDWNDAFWEDFNHMVLEDIWD